MNLRFNLNNLTVTIPEGSRGEWYLRNSQIPVGTDPASLTDEHKKALARLAIYEGHIDTEQLANWRDITIVP